MKYILVHDIGTSGNKATLFNTQGEIVSSEIGDYETYYINDVCIEQDPIDWWQSVIDTTKTLLNKVDPSDIVAVSFSGHMQGVVCLDEEGNVLHNSMIWMDQRATKETKSLCQKISPERIYEITGHRPSSVYSLEKVMWLKANKPEIYSKTKTILNTKDYIIYRLTNIMVTDYTDASGTNALDLIERCWSEEIISAAGLDMDKFPRICDSTDVVGLVSEEASILTGLSPTTKVVCGGGDGACATVGAGCIEDDDTYCCMGTSAWIATTASKPFIDKKMTVVNFAHMIPNKYIPCGAMSSCGTAYDWGLEVFAKMEKVLAKEAKVSIHEYMEKQMKQSVVGANGLIFLPHMHGERSPRWNPDAKGVFFGLSTNHKSHDMMRAILEGVVLNLNVILDVFKQFYDVKKINLIGGGANNLHHQILSDVFGATIQTIANGRYASAIGAAIAGGVGVGVFDDFNAVNRFVKVTNEFNQIEENSLIYEKKAVIFDEVYFGLVKAFKL